MFILYKLSNVLSTTTSFILTSRDVMPSLSLALKVTSFSAPVITALFSRVTSVMVGISLSTIISCSTELTFPERSVAETFKVYSVCVLFMAVPLPLNFFAYWERSMVILKGASLSSPTLASSIKASTLLMPLASWALISISTVFPIIGGASVLLCVTPLIEKSTLGGVMSGASSLSLLHEMHSTLNKSRTFR